MSENSGFFNEDSDVVIPGMGNEVEDKSSEYSELYTEGLEKAITGKQVKQVIVASADDFEYPSYLIDMTNVGYITEESLNAIDGLLTGGDVAVYIKNGDRVMKVGSGEDSIFYAVLNGVLKQMFAGKCVVYKNKGDGFKILKENEVDTVRLNL